MEIRVGRGEYRAVYAPLRGRDSSVVVGAIEIAKDLSAERAARARVVWTIGGAVSLLSGRSADLLLDHRFSLPGWMPDLLLSDNCRAWASVPLIAEGEVLGTLALGDSAGRRFTEGEIQVLSAFAGQAGLALRNVRLLVETDRRRREAWSLAELARSVAEDLSVSEVARRVIGGVMALYGPRAAGLRVARTEGSLEIVASAGVNFPVGHVLAPGEGMPGRAVRERRLVFVEDLTTDPSVLAPAGLRAAYVEKGLRSVLAVPLRVRKTVVGTLAMGFGERMEAVDPRWELLQAFADQAALAVGNARLFEEQERRRLARELHDELGQALTAVKLTLQSLAGPGASAGAGGRLDEAMGLVDRALSQVRGLSLDLRPSLLDDLGLASALRWYVTRQAERAGLAATVAADLEEARPGPDIETACFRVVQEAMTNAVRHAGARRVSVEVKAREGEIALAVRDDGAGFDVEAARSRAASGESLGLLGMEERVLLLGGTLDIESAPGQGTEVRVRIPLGPPSGSTGHSEGGTGS